MASVPKWFGVKTLYRSVAKGAPTGTDRHYADDVALVEERIVLFEARNAEQALRKADREATAYARARFRNAYGQDVFTQYLGYCEAYDISPDKPARTTEVFSTMELVPRSMSKKELLQRLFGYRESNRNRLCRNLGDIVFQKPAAGVQLSRSERAFVARCVATLKGRDA